MNLVNRVMNGVFDVIMTPFELLGVELALILVSGIVGILCLILFKFISWQKGIKAAKDKLKGHIIAIRLYQDDLAIVGGSVAKILLRNFQYLGLNFGPILPLLIPFALVLAQLVVRYGYDPLPVETQQTADEMMSGEGTLVTISMGEGQAQRVSGIDVEFPEGIEAISPMVRVPSTGKAFVEVAAFAPVIGEIQVMLDGQVVGTKEITAGDRTRRMQGRRTSSFWWSWLLPAESTFASGDAIADVEFVYPSSDLRFGLPGGEGGILVIFFIASIVFGIAVLKPLNIQI